MSSNTLKYRIATAAVLILVILAMMWELPATLFAVVVTLFFIMGAWEWGYLTGIRRWYLRVLYVFLVVILIFFSYFVIPWWIFGGAAVIWCWALAGIIRYQLTGHALGFELPVVKGLFGVLSMVACWNGVTVLQAISPWCLLTVFALIWAVDTGAYFSGRRWGKHPLAERISPKKTREGFWGGIILALLIIGVASFMAPMTPVQHILFPILVFISALFAVVGDLFVSMLKRQTGLKDTSSFLPGHGGFLDRLDSTISTTPIFALLFLLLMTL